jgi:uncharacterized protein DUF3300
MRIIDGRPKNPAVIGGILKSRKAITLGGWLIGPFMRVMASGLILCATFPVDDVLAQTAPAPAAQPAAAQPFNNEQLDALVASIALYPDDLLTQLLMASTFPLEVDKALSRTPGECANYLRNSGYGPA